MNGSTWSARDLELLRQTYPDLPTADVAAQLGRSTRAVYSMAKLQGLKKSAAYLASESACRLRRGDNVGAASRFPKGHVPANKGLRRPGWAPGRMAETQFKPGTRPPNWQPVGAERLSKEGYLQRKLTDTGYPPRDWVPVHHIIWREASRAIPPGFRLIFTNGDKTDIRLDNLQLISLADNMRRNSVHHLPPAIKEVVNLKRAIVRRITIATRKEATP
jgi:hypothetical protein